MEELIEILIRLIAGFVQNKGPAPTRRTSAPARPAPANPPPIATRKNPLPRRPGRRPAPPMIAVAQPILTTVSNVTTAPIIPMARSIVANAGIAKPNAVPPESAASIRKWLTPATLKNQFLLTDILQPPLALREKP